MAWKKSTTTKHTCGGPAFGRRTAGCPRCDELAAGAAPVTQPWRKHYADMAAQRAESIRTHDCKRAGCMSVCVAFDW